MKNILLVIISLYGLNSSAQQWNWTKTISYPYNDPAENHLASVHDGSFYVSTNFDTNSCISKFDSSGIEQWRVYLSGSNKINSIAAFGNRVYATGNYQNLLSVGSFAFNSQGMDDGFIISLSSGGNILWGKSIGGSQKDNINGICIDKYGSVYLTGEYSGTCSIDSLSLTCTCTSNLFIIKYDSLSNIKYVKSGQCVDSLSNSKGIRCAVDDDLNVHVMGRFSYFKLDTFNVNGGNSMYSAWFVAKVDSAQQVEWIETVNYTVLTLYDMAVDADKNVFVTGDLSWTGGGQGLTRKYDRNGSFIWEKRINGSCYGDGSISTAIEADGDNAYNLGPLSFAANCAHVSRCVLFLNKYDSLGNQSFYDTISLGGGWNFYAYNYDITKVSANEFVICGKMDGELAFGNDSLHSSTRTVFIAKFTDNVLTSIQNIYSGSGISVYPNPSSGVYTIDLNNFRNARLVVRDVLGNCIENKVCTNNKTATLDLTGHGNGIYFLELITEEGRVVKKIILQ